MGLEHDTPRRGTRQFTEVRVWQGEGDDQERTTKITRRTKSHTREAFSSRTQDPAEGIKRFTNLAAVRAVESSRKPKKDLGPRTTYVGTGLSATSYSGIEADDVFAHSYEPDEATAQTGTVVFDDTKTNINPIEKFIAPQLGKNKERKAMRRESKVSTFGNNNRFGRQL